MRKDWDELVDNNCQLVSRFKSDRKRVERANSCRFLLVNKRKVEKLGR